MVTRRRQVERVVAALQAAEAVGTGGYEEAFRQVGLDPGEWVLVRASDWIELLLLLAELEE